MEIWGARHAGGILMDDSLFDKSLIYVTGKGGVGKTTVAASLGIAAAARGLSTIVCEVAEQDRVSRAFLHHPVRPESEVPLDDGLWAISVDPRQALEEWLERQIGAGTLVRTLARSHAFQYFVAAAPGAKELITMGKVWELAQLERWDRRARTYDLVIVDAPASGHGVAMLKTPQTFGEIARVGPIRRQAGKIRTMFSDPARTGYVGVALPEEMPVNETLDLERRLRDTVGLDLDAVVVNAVYPDRFTNEEADRLRVAAERDGYDPAAAGAVRAALVEHERARAQRGHIRRLRRGTDAKVLTLPFLFDPELGLDDYRRLGAELGRKLG
jgi:anion-transporting  ArsA/GET3 family ATPase